MHSSFFGRSIAQPVLRPAACWYQLGLFSLPMSFTGSPQSSGGVSMIEAGNFLR